MEIFLVNLEKDKEKREKILSQLKKLNLSAQIIPAVYGKELSEQELKEKVYDYPKCSLALGEIGCALSHLNIYNKMIAKDTPIAFILEDDAIISPQVPTILDYLEKTDNKNKANIYLLSYVTDYLPLTKQKTPIGNIYKAYRCYNTFAYVANQEAAKRIAKVQMPLKFEADMWEYFKLLLGVNIYCIMPDLVYDSDANKEFSSIEKERAALKKKRMHYRKKVVFKYWPLFMFKKLYYRLLVKLFSKKTIRK